MGRTLQELDYGVKSRGLNLFVTEQMREELELWAEIAGWSLSKTVRYLIVKGMSFYEAPFNQGGEHEA